MDDHQLAADLAARAGELLVGLRSELGWDDPVRLRAAGDHQSNALLLEALASARPGDAVLSEESADDLARLDARRVWIVDPLDGTREFAEAGRTDWAVHVALWQAGDLAAGAVALPAVGRLYSTASPCPAPAPSDGGPLRIAVSRSRPPAFVSELCERLSAEPVALGSAGAKTMAVVEGTVDAYVHAGGQYEWDSAAPAVVARHAGLSVSRLDGSRLAYNRADPLLPDLVVCRPELAERLVTTAQMLVSRSG